MLALYVIGAIISIRYLQRHAENMLTCSTNYSAVSKETTVYSHISSFIQTAYV